jgi:hypothetical protein
VCDPDGTRNQEYGGNIRQRGIGVNRESNEKAVISGYPKSSPPKQNPEARDRTSGSFAPRITPELEFLYLRIPVEISNSRKGQTEFLCIGSGSAISRTIPSRYHAIMRLRLDPPPPSDSCFQAQDRLQEARVKLPRYYGATASWLACGACSLSRIQQGLGKQGVEEHQEEGWLMSAIGDGIPREVGRNFNATVRLFGVLGPVNNAHAAFAEPVPILYPPLRTRRELETYEILQHD